MKNKLEKSTQLLDSLKTSINNSLDKQISYIIQQIKTTNIRYGNYDNNNNIEINELINNKIEEILIDQKGNKMMNFLKVKSLYDINEKDYKEKIIKTKYFINILNYIKKNLIENALIVDYQIDNKIGKENENNKINELFNYGTLQKNEFKNVYNNEINQKLFPFLELNMLKDQTFNKNNNEIENSVLQMRLLNNNINNNDNTKFFDQTVLNNLNNTMNENVNNYLNRTFNNLNNNNQNVFNPNNISMMNPLLSNNILNNNNNNNFNNYNNNLLESNRLNQTTMPFYSNSLRTNSFNNFDNFNNNFNNNNNNNNYLNNSLKNFQILPKEITNNFSNENFRLYSKILDFLNDESNKLLKESEIIEKKKNLQNDLNFLNETGEMLEFNEMISKEKFKDFNKEKNHKEKIEIFNLIKNNSEDAFNFILNNPNRKEIVKDKFNLILENINDYKKTFNNFYDFDNNNFRSSNRFFSTERKNELDRKNKEDFLNFNYHNYKSKDFGMNFNKSNY